MVEAAYTSLNPDGSHLRNIFSYCNSFSELNSLFKLSLPLMTITVSTKLRKEFGCSSWHLNSWDKSNRPVKSLQSDHPLLCFTPTSLPFALSFVFLISIPRCSPILLCSSPPPHTSFRAELCMEVAFEAKRWEG